MHLSDEMKKCIKKVFDTTINENSSLKKQDLANATRRLISRYLSGKRGDTDIGELQKLFEYIQRVDLWKADFLDNEELGNELYYIFEKIRKEIKIITRCGKENKCDKCEKIKKEGFEDPCPECDKCNGGLRIGYAMEFYEFINDEVLDLDKFDINRQATSQIINNNELRTEENQENRIESEGNQNQDINTDSNNINNNEMPQDINQNQEGNINNTENVNINDGVIDPDDDEVPDIYDDDGIEI